MNKWGMFLAGFLLMGTSIAHADSMRFFGQLDYWLKGNSFDDYQKSTNDLVDALVNVVGYDSANATIKTTGAYGARVGIMSPANPSGWRAGASIGYLQGPSSDTTINAFSTIGGDGRATEKMKTNFIRALFEFQDTIMGRDNYGFKLKGGIGVAQGRIKSDQTFSGSFLSVFGAPANFSASDKWTGVTWEIGPAFVASTESFDFDFGLMYSGFPTLKENDNFGKFQWNALGLQFAVNFKPPRAKPKQEKQTTREESTNTLWK